MSTPDERSQEEHCEHYDELVGVTIIDISESDVDCSWCGGSATVGLVQSQRHDLALCPDCDAVLTGLYTGEEADTP